jgi:hypothetical protein
MMGVDLRTNKIHKKEGAFMYLQPLRKPKSNCSGS